MMKKFILVCLAVALAFPLMGLKKQDRLVTMDGKTATVKDIGEGWRVVNPDSICLVKVNDVTWLDGPCTVAVHDEARKIEFLSKVSDLFVHVNRWDKKYDTDDGKTVFAKAFFNKGEGDKANIDLGVVIAQEACWHHVDDGGKTWDSTIIICARDK